MKHTRQMSESIELGIVLAISGGFMDAYSYLCRDHVFANAQTGNMLLLGVNLAEGNWSTALRYGCPVLAFAIGIAIADIVRIRLKELSLFHWRQIAVLLEAFVLFGVSMIPLSMNLLANSLTSLACGIQVECFRKIHGNGVATTMCIGNLRSATQHICEYWYFRNKKAVRKGFLYYGIILMFITGAVIGNASVHIWGVKAIRICSITLGIAFLMMFIDREKMEVYGGEE